MFSNELPLYNFTPSGVSGDGGMRASTVADSDLVIAICVFTNRFQAIKSIPLVIVSMDNNRYLWVLRRHGENQFIRLFFGIESLNLGKS